MTRRSLGELTVNIIAADASFVQGMDRVERKAVRTAAATAAAQKKAARESEQAWAAASASMSGLSDKQYTAAMRGLPAQFTDIVVSLQGGQNPLTVFLQQGGQIKDMFGGVGNALTAVTRGIAAMINPVTVLGAAVGVLAYGWYAGSQESKAFLVALETTGNKAGTTVANLNDMARAMDGLEGVTRGKAAEALTIFATQAGVGEDRLQRYATTAIAWEKATGESADKVAERFKKIADDPVKGLLELNKQMGFLTSATFEQVKALQQAGKETEAAQVAQDAYDRAVASAAKTINQNLGTVERTWNAIKSAALGALDAIKAVGRDTTQQEAISKLEKTLADREARGPLNDATAEAFNRGNARLLAQIENAKSLLGLQNSVDAYGQKAIAREQTLIDLSVEADRYADKKLRKEREIAAAREKFGEAAKNDAKAAAQLAQVIAGIEEKYKDPKSPKGRTRRTDEEKQAERDKRAAEAYMKALTAEGDGRKNLTKYGQLLYDIDEGRIKLTADQLALAKEAALEADKRTTAEQLTNLAIESRKSLMEEGRSLSESLLTPQEKYAKNVERLNFLLEEGAIKQKDYGRALGKYYEDLTGVAADYGRTVANGLQNILGDELAKGLDASFKGILSSFLKMLLQMETRALSVNLMSLLDGGKTPSNSSGLGSLLGKAGEWLSSLLPGRASGGPVAGGSMYRVNELGPELLSYGGSDYLMMGGQGGYVKPLGAADTERRGAGNITVVNQTTGRVDNVERRQLTEDDVVLIIQEHTPKVMVNQTQNANSPFSRTMSSSFNTSRRR